jgi:hypothetical protein
MRWPHAWSGELRLRGTIAGWVVPLLRIGAHRRGVVQDTRAVPRPIPTPRRTTPIGVAVLQFGAALIDFILVPIRQPW